MSTTKTASALGLMLLAPFTPTTTNGNSCVSENFYGIYRDGDAMKSIYMPDENCLDTWLQSASADVVSASIVPVSNKHEGLVWLERKAVDDELLPSDIDAEFAQILKGQSMETLPRDYETGQSVMQEGSKGSYEVLYRSPSAALLAVPRDNILSMDTMLPPYWVARPLPESPVAALEDVSSSALGRVRHILANLKYSSTVQSIIDSISAPQMKNDIRFLTGEDPISSIVSRHSFSEGSRVASKWLKSRFEETGATCELKSFLTGFAPNVICRYPALDNTTETILISGHYDSRGSFGSTRAPGGDDDGSGTVSLLGIARAIARKGVQFHKNVELVAFAGEEQGLLGSKAYSRELKDANANLTLMIQADMLAYHRPGEPAQLGLPQTIGTPEVTQMIANLSALYSPELEVGYSPACCSDHQSFWEKGFPASQVFERAGPIADPMYHNSGDLSDREGYDFNQLRSISKVQFATLLHAAGYELSKPLDSE